MERQRVKEDKMVEAIMCLFTLPSQDQPLEHKWTLLSSMTTTSPNCLSMRCRSLRMRAKKASLASICQDTICSRHDLSRHISRCLFLSHKTRSVKTHFTMRVSVTHSMSTSPVPVIEFVAPASAVTYTELSPVTTCQHPCSAFSSNRTRGTYTCCHLHTCCLLCSD